MTLGHDEEIGGFKGAQEITKWLTRRLGPNPFEFLWDEGLFVIDRVVPGHRGPVAMICTSEKGSLTLELTAQVWRVGARSACSPSVGLQRWFVT